MPHAIRIGIIEDFEPAHHSHCATNAGLCDPATELKIPLVIRYLPMPSVEDGSADENLHRWDGAIMRRFAIATLFFMFFGLIAAGLCQPAEAQSKLAVELQQKIDQIAADTLTKAQEPSASIAVVKDGEIAYLHPEEFTQVSQDLRGGMILRVYSIKCSQMNLQAWSYELPNGKLEQYLVAAQN